MDLTLKLVLEKARQAPLRALRTEVSEVGSALVVRAVLQLAEQEFSAHTVALNIEDLGRAEEEAIGRVCGFAGLSAAPEPQAQPAAGRPALVAVPSVAPSAPPRPGIFDNSGPLYPEVEELPAEEPAFAPPEPEDPPFDRDQLMAESSQLMSTLRMDAKAGRNYLTATYGKRGRGELSDGELQSFVEYLRAQNHTHLTSQLPF